MELNIEDLRVIIFIQWFFFSIAGFLSFRPEQANGWVGGWVGVAPRLMVHINFPLDIMKEEEKDGLRERKENMTKQGLRRRK